MPFPRPKLSTLRNQAKAYINGALRGADALLRHSNLGILGDLVAEMINATYGYLDWIARQATPFTATGIYLEAWAALKGVLRKPAAAATGTVTFAGATGTVLPAGSAVVRSGGATYTTQADATVAGGVLTATVKADKPGADGNGNAGVAMTLAVAVPGIAASGVAAGPLTGGADVETDDDLRTRMLIAYAKPPQGGASDDYVEWGMEVPGVTRCWVTPNGMGAGTVIVYFMMDDAQAANGGFPQGTNGVAAAEDRAMPATGDQLMFANALYSKRPVTALVYAVAPAPNSVNITLAGLSGASLQVKAAIASAFAAAIALKSKPGGVTHLSTIEAAIAAVPGSAGFVITNVTASQGTVSPAPVGNIISNTGYLAVPGVVSYL